MHFVLQVLIKSRRLSAECLLGLTALSAVHSSVRKILCALRAECTQSPECCVNLGSAKPRAGHYERHHTPLQCAQKHAQIVSSELTTKEFD